MHTLFPSLLTLLALVGSCNASLANYTIDDTFGDQRTGVKPAYDSPWLSQAECSDVPEYQPCQMNIDTAAAFNGTWHATAYDADISFTFEGSAIYFYFIPAFSTKSLVNSFVSIVLDGVEMHQFDQYAVRETVSGSGPVYANTSLPMGVHDVVIRNYGMNSDSLVSVAVFDYVIYSYEDGDESDAAILSAAISIASGISFLSICGFVGVLLRSRSRRKRSIARIEPWVPDLPSNATATSAGCPGCFEVDLDKIEKQEYFSTDDYKVGMDRWSFGSSMSAQASTRHDAQPSPIRPNPLDKGSKANVQPSKPRPEAVKPQFLGLDVFLAQSSLAANESLGIWRRRSTLSRLGVRLGEGSHPDRSKESDPLFREHDVTRATGASRHRACTDAVPSAGTRGVEDRGVDGVGYDLSAQLSRQDDVELIARLQAEVHILRLERDRRRSLPGEEPPAYEELDGSEDDDAALQ